MDYSNLVPWTISVISLLFVILTFVRNGNKDKKNEIQEEDSKFDGIKEGLIKANMKLDQVCATTNETRADIKSLNKDIQSLDSRMSIVEGDVKLAFRLIDDIKVKVQ